MKRSWLAITTASLLIAALFSSPPAVNAQAVAQSYGAASDVQLGMLVQLDPKDSSSVVPVSSDNADKTQGVAVSPTDAPIAVSNMSPTRQVYVATTNSYPVLVSDQNGVIKKGDYIAVSALAGIGMKADAKQSTVVGKALNGFDGSGTVNGSTSLKDSTGKTRTVHIGTVAVAIGIARNPLHTDASGGGSAIASANIPGFLKNASTLITDKPVSAARLYLSLLVLCVTAVIVGSLLYGAVRTSITSVGRNPLAKSAIFHSLGQVSLISLSVLITGLVVVYLLLKL